MTARRRKGTHRGNLTILGILAAATVASWWLFLRGEDETVSPAARTLTAVASTAPVPPSRAPDEVESSSPSPTVVTETREPPLAPQAPAPSVLGKLESAAEARRRNDLIGARTFLREAWALEPAEPDRTRIRAELLDLAQETILSPRAYDGDPLVLRYVLKPGDTLAKVAAEHKTTADLLASMNRIADKHLVRAGQTIKVVRGPFHAVVDKSSYVLDVMLGETLVRSFAVGLGADDGTPNGLWRVSSKLSNPTYYPPRGGAIMAADDPANPLGERWIGLTGVDGAAVGQERYGIHGTIEPDSIGRSTSMGCIRLNNADVEQLYTYLAEKHSTVIVR